MDNSEESKDFTRNEGMNIEGVIEQINSCRCIILNGRSKGRYLGFSKCSCGNIIFYGWMHGEMKLKMNIFKSSFCA